MKNTIFFYSTDVRRGNGRHEQAPPDDDEEREEGELHPLVTVTKIDPNEIPEVSNEVFFIKDVTKMLLPYRYPTNF